MSYFCDRYYKSIKDATVNSVLDIDLILLTQCNQRCSYCFMHSNPRNHDYVNDDVLNALAKKIVEYKKPVDLTLLGGEPTIHPKLKEIIDRFSHVPNIRNMDIHTNGRKSLKNILNKRLTIVFSIHPEYSRYIETIIKHIREVQGETRVKVKVLYHPFFKNQIAFLEKKLSECGIPFRRDVIHGFRDEEQDFDTNDMFNVNGELMPLKYIIDNNLDRFKNWMCLNHCLRVNADGSIFEVCNNKHKNILDKNYKLGKTLILCAKDKCVSSWALHTLKVTT